MTHMKHTKTLAAGLAAALLFVAPAAYAEPQWQVPVILLAGYDTYDSQQVVLGPGTYQAEWLALSDGGCSISLTGDVQRVLWSGVPTGETQVRQFVLDAPATIGMHVEGCGTSTSTVYTQ